MKINAISDQCELGLARRRPITRFVEYGRDFQEQLNVVYLTVNQRIYGAVRSDVDKLYRRGYHPDDGLPLRLF